MKGNYSKILVIVSTVIISSVVILGGVYFWKNQNNLQTKVSHQLAGKPEDKVIDFTAIYDKVSIFSDGFGGRLVSLQPDTEELQKEMFRKVVFFSYQMQWIGIEQPKVTQENSIKLPESQKLKVTGFYHKPQHRPYAKIVELAK